MSTRKESAAVVGVGAVACAACCAGPILGFLAALGLGTIAGVVLFGVIGLAVVATVALVVMARRRRSRRCTGAPAVVDVVDVVDVEMPTIRAR